MKTNNTLTACALFLAVVFALYGTEHVNLYRDPRGISAGRRRDVSMTEGGYDDPDYGGEAFGSGGGGGR
jgi:hypothetical protein